MTNLAIFQKHYNQLVGYKIIEAVVEEDEVFGEDLPFVALIMQKGKDKLIVHVSADPEGNGTGHLEISAYEEN